MGKATGGGGNGGALGGGGGGLGGGGGGYNVLTAAPKDMSRSEGAQGGGGVFIIRWGNSPL